MKNDYYDRPKVIKKFNSKRNEVFLIEGQERAGKKFILKRYWVDKYLYKEEKILRRLKNDYLNVPEIYYRGSDYMVMEYISGKTFLAYLLEQESLKKEIKKLQPVINKLCEWLNDFYNIMRKNGNIIRGDINFRNFILHESPELNIKEIYGLDFENPGKGSIEKDVGKIAAFLVTYSPVFTEWKLKLAQYLYRIMIKKFFLEPELITKHYQSELGNIEQRRGLRIPKNIYNLLMSN